jgi:uncharacterized protein YndB with AHSA1/START domain
LVAADELRSFANAAAGTHGKFSADKEPHVESFRPSADRLLLRIGAVATGQQSDAKTFGESGVTCHACSIRIDEPNSSFGLIFPISYPSASELHHSTLPDLVLADRLPLCRRTRTAEATSFPRGKPMNINNFKPAIAYTIYIASTPEKVWEALTSAEFSRKYFFGLAVEMEPRVGGAFVVRNPDGSVHISGEVFEHRRPDKLTVTWNVNWPALIEKLGPTLVTYEIEQAGEAVKLTLLQSHDRPISDDILSGGREGWPAILSSLKSLLETGEPLLIKMQPPQRMLAALKELGIATP